VKKLKISVLVFIGLLLLIQLIPVSRTNPGISGDIQATAGLKQLLRRSCYDCHSYETRWPWYSYVAPVSWLVLGDVQKAREHLNFSLWEEYSPLDQAHFRKKIIDEVTKGEMPLPQYMIMHPEARITETDVELFKQWIDTRDDLTL